MPPRVDHDDLLAPDCVRVVTHALVAAGYPALAYTDEDKVDERNFRDPYFKPDWDPVLFAASCYIAHLIVFDRQQALALGAYTDQATEGSHDWDTFMRFTLAQFVPVHIPEVLYTWRMHADSTAGNIQSKPYVASSHQRVLQKFVAAAARPDWYRIEASPLFAGTPDWWIRRQRVDPWPITTVLIREGGDGAAALSLDPAISHDVAILPPGAGIAALEPIVERCAEARRLVHVLWAGTEIEGAEWPWEAMAQFELFPDTAVVGGRIHCDGRILSAASYFGFGRGCDSPGSRTLRERQRLFRADVEAALGKCRARAALRRRARLLQRVPETLRPRPMSRCGNSAPGWARSLAHKGGG